MIQSMNTGHDGSLSTGHANSPRDMLSRLETMILMAMELPLSAIRRQIASAVDILIHLGRMRDRSRKVMEIVEITGYDRRNHGADPVSAGGDERTTDGGSCQKTGASPCGEAEPGGNCTGKDVRVRLWREIMESGSFPGKRRRN